MPVRVGFFLRDLVDQVDEGLPVLLGQTLQEDGGLPANRACRWERPVLGCAAQARGMGPTVTPTGGSYR
ncbi:hypothetical protein FAF44_39730 [Nonomuraea sp. MG754425]|uniref:hypothetical protein n=1 Tax=Nonomuraea sp. MG754425 TaxID=2570319 RepID=UPI001F21EFA1|nr:hypothetical protein [Nonomuraea sp. MG754425]MCF6474469.1 hypothetical protein [Nonomuraea sp. MG754425]